MPNLDLLNESDALRLRHLGRPLVAEIVKISWPQPHGTIHYAFRGVNKWIDEREFPFEPFEVRLITQDSNPFLNITRVSAISDDVVPLEMGNIDGKMIELLRKAVGAKVEIFYYFPQINLSVTWF